MINYIAPIIEIIEVAVEDGFAISGNMDSCIIDWNNENIEGNTVCF